MVISLPSSSHHPLCTFIVITFLEPPSIVFLMRQDHHTARSRHTITRPSPSLGKKEKSPEYVLKAIVFFSPHSFPFSVFISIMSVSSSRPSFPMVSLSFSCLQSDRRLFILVHSFPSGASSTLRHLSHVVCLSQIVSFSLSCLPYFYIVLLLDNMSFFLALFFPVCRSSNTSLASPFCFLFIILDSLFHNTSLPCFHFSCVYFLSLRSI